MRSFYHFGDCGVVFVVVVVVGVGVGGVGCCFVVVDWAGGSESGGVNRDTTHF